MRARFGKDLPRGEVRGAAPLRSAERRQGVLARGLALVPMALFAASVAWTPAHAGFFDQLFGGPPAAPAYDPGDAPQVGPSDAPVARPRPRKRIVREIAPVKQTPTDLMHDKTLRPGDAVMMKDGVHVYDGPVARAHDRSEFVPLAHADVSKGQRTALLPLDTSRNDPLRGRLTPDTLASGRSAAVGASLSQGYRITDPRGRSIRYVGP